MADGTAPPIRVGVTAASDRRGPAKLPCNLRNFLYSAAIIFSETLSQLRTPNNPRSGGAFFINAVRELWAREVVSVLDVRLVIRVRLQSVEDDLRAAGKRNVKIAGDAGVFTWVLRGAGREPCEALSSFDHIRDLEAMILTAGMDYLVEMTQHGTFTWRLR